MKRILAALLTVSLMLIFGLPVLTVSVSAGEPGEDVYPTGGCRPVYAFRIEEDDIPAGKSAPMRGAGDITAPDSREGRVIFDSLTEGQRQLFMFMLTLGENLIFGGDTSVKFTDPRFVNIAPVTEIVTKDDALLVFEYMIMNEPQLFWLKNGFAYSGSKYNITGIRLISDYDMDTIITMQAEIEEAVDEPLTAAVNMPSDTRAARYFYDWIINRGSYCYAAVSNPDSYRYAYSMYGIAVAGEGVCSSYAMLFTYLLNKCGIEAYGITGYGQSDRHAWNIAYLDGALYEFDLTWDDKTNGPSFVHFAITTAEMTAKNHTRETDKFMVHAPVADTVAIANDFLVADSDLVVENQKLVKYKGPGGVLYLPGGISVIGNNALRPGYPNYKLLACVIPEGVTEIEVSAFVSCQFMTSVVLPASLVSVASNAFGSASALSKVYYSGSAEEYSQITVTESGNSRFIEAEKIYDFTPLAYQRADYGDADLDSGAAFADIAAMRAAIAAGGSSAHDLNRDLVVNIRDLLILRRLIAGIG